MTFNHVDIHSQLQFPQFDEDRDVIIAQMKELGIATITVGTDFEMSKKAVGLAENHSNLFATIGIHPTHIEEQGTRNDAQEILFDEVRFESLLGPNVVAVGECGLDYYRTQIDADETQTKANKDQQRRLFIQQIEFAKKHSLPLMLHCRPSPGTMDAYEEALDILANYPGVSGDFHFFVGDTEIAKRVVDAGFTASFDGPVTFTDEYDDVIRSIPSDMIMAETDAPFAAPVPHRGKRNSPLYVPFISDRLADIRGEDREAFRVQTVENARRVFGVA